MVFYLAGTGGNCDTCNWIVAEGTITSDTPELFASFISDKRKTGNIPQYLHINSPGGELFAAIKLGDLFRKSEISVFVAKTLGEFDNSGSYIDDRLISRNTAICASACVVAFAGGKRRLTIKDHYANAISVSRDRKFLVHQFYSADALVEPEKNNFLDSIGRQIKL